VAVLQDQAKQAIDAAEFETAEGLLERATELDNASADKFKENYIQRKRSAAESQGLKAKSLHTRFEFVLAQESYKRAIELAQRTTRGR
jgi:Tfp pilus assembly protein PilF